MDEFVGLLQSVQVTLLGDVRTVPRSRTNPQYNREALPDSLQPYGIGYEHMASLGGLRSRVRAVAPAVNGFWTNKSFNYADYAMGERFRGGLAHLRRLGETQRCAVMCAETVWWRCHRRIITDYLLAAGEQVFHILAAGKSSGRSSTRRLTGPIFTGPGQSTHTQSQNGFFEPNCAWVDAPASSGSIQWPPSGDLLVYPAEPSVQHDLFAG